MSLLTTSSPSSCTQSVSSIVTTQYRPACPAMPNLNRSIVAIVLTSFLRLLVAAEAAVRRDAHKGRPRRARALCPVGGTVGAEAPLVIPLVAAVEGPVFAFDP